MSRVEAFSDGVFAIAITLLVLEIRPPQTGVEGGLASALGALWPSYVAFASSFFVVLVMWVNHHQLGRLVQRVNYPYLFANGLLLLSVTFVPFPTAVLAGYLGGPESRVAATFYCGSYVVNSVAWYVLFTVIARCSLFSPEVDAPTIRRLRRAYRVGPLAYGFATLVAVAWPLLGLVVNASLWLLWIRLSYQPGRGPRVVAGATPALGDSAWRRR